MIGAIISNTLLKLLHHLIASGLTILCECSIKSLCEYYDIISTDLQNIKHQIIDCCVIKALDNVQNALIHLKIANSEFNNKKRNSLKDAIKYFNQAIIASKEAMSFKMISLKDFILCMEIQFLSQLFTENFLGVQLFIQTKLIEFAKKSELHDIYQYLFFDGSNINSKEIEIAYLIFDLINKLKKLDIVDINFIENQLNIRISTKKSIFAIGKKSVYINLSHPRIKIKENSQKMKDFFNHSSVIVSVPTAFIVGLWTASLLTIAYPLLLQIGDVGYLDLISEAVIGFPRDILQESFQDSNPIEFFNFEID